MFEAEYLLFCSGTTTDERGNLSLHGIFDVIYAQNFPTQHRPFTIAFKLRASKAFIKQHLTIKLSVELDNKEQNRADMEGDFTVEKGNSLGPALDISQFVFPRAGSYHFKLYVNDNLSIARTLQIRSADELSEP